MNTDHAHIADQVWNVAESLGGLVPHKADNPVWSPACLTQLLAMLRLGSAGETQRELDKLLGEGDCLAQEDPFGISKVGFSPYREYAARNAEGLWVSRTAEPSRGFLDACERTNIEVKSVDEDSVSAGVEIARWIAEQTNGLLSPDVTMPEDELACLVAALYLKDAWCDPFDAEDTVADVFHREDEDVPSAFMRGKRREEVRDIDDVTVFSIDFSCGERALFALPCDNRRIGFGEAARLFHLFCSGENELGLLDLSVPRFECEAMLDNVAGMLERSGVSTARSMNLKPMTGVSAAPIDIVHAAKLIVNEGGIEAGSYSMAIAFEGIPAPVSVKRKIVLNRPFAFAVVSRTGVPLFMGMVDRPSYDARLKHRGHIDEESTYDRMVHVLSQKLAQMPPDRNMDMRELASITPSVLVLDDGSYTVAGMDGNLSPDQLDFMLYDVMVELEGQGMRVNHHGDRVFSVHTLLDDPEEFDYDQISHVRLSAGGAMNVDSDEIDLRFARNSDGEKTGRLEFCLEEDWFDHRKTIVELDVSGAQRAIEALERAGVASWRRSYECDGVLDGWDWDLDVYFEDGRAFLSGGFNDCPSTFGRLWNDLAAIAGVQMPDRRRWDAA